MRELCYIQIRKFLNTKIPRVKRLKVMSFCCNQTCYSSISHLRTAVHWILAADLKLVLKLALNGERGRLVLIFMRGTVRVVALFKEEGRDSCLLYGFATLDL